MPKFAFVFPGQGSQAVGMLNGFADNKVVQDTLAEASDALGFDLGKMIAEGPKEDLDLTTNTQPVMLTSSVAFYRAWIAAGGALPEVVAGHSLGEFSALVCFWLSFLSADACPNWSVSVSRPCRKRSCRSGQHGSDHWSLWR